MKCVMGLWMIDINCRQSRVAKLIISAWSLFPNSTEKFYNIGKNNKQNFFVGNVAVIRKMFISGKKIDFVCHTKFGNELDHNFKLSKHVNYIYIYILKVYNLWTLYFKYYITYVQ